MDRDRTELAARALRLLPTSSTALNRRVVPVRTVPFVNTHVVQGRNPIDAGRLHGYRLYPTALQPVSHTMQVSCKTLKPAYWFLISIRPHGDVMRVVPHINSCGMRMNHLQAWVLGLQSSCPLLSLFPISPQLLACRHA